MNTELQSSKAALEMYLLRKEIECFNANPEAYDECEIETLERQRERILKEFYANAYGENVLPLLAVPA